MKSSECLLPEGLGGVAGRPTLLKLLPLLWAYSRYHSMKSSECILPILGFEDGYSPLLSATPGLGKRCHVYGH